MPRREPPPAKDFAFDFTADWVPYAAIAPGSAAAKEGWTLHGTLRKDGKTYGLAHSKGMYAGCDLRGGIRSLTALEQSAIARAVEFRQVPGLENAPKKPVGIPIGLTGPSQLSATRDYHTPVNRPDGACEACGKLYYRWADVGTVCTSCRTGFVLPGHCWDFVQWPNGDLTATPSETLTEEDVEKIRERCRRKR
jgi:hypothetical protein